MRRRRGDIFGAELSRVRGEVRQAAAELLRESAEPPVAAKLMLDRAQQLWQHDLPFIGFDVAALQYTQARAWQDCARAIDQSLPVVQQRLNRADTGRPRLGP